MANPLQRKGIFGAPMAGTPFKNGTPPIWGGPEEAIAVPDLPTPPMSIPDLGAAPRVPTTFFGEGGAGRTIAGGIGDALLQFSGMRPVFQPMVQQQRELSVQQAAEQRRQAAEWSMWTKQKQWERDHPMPHYWETNNGSLAAIGPDGQPRVVYSDPTPKVDWITANNPDGTKQLVPMVNGQPRQANPTAPVGKLTPMGGPMPSASGGFPVR